MKVVRNSKGVVFVTRVGKWLTIHVAENEAGPWHGVRSPAPGDCRDELLRKLGPKVCERLELA